MTDGNEDVATEGRKCYLWQWHQVNGDRHINTHERHCCSLNSMVTPHSTRKQEHTYTSDVPGYRRLVIIYKLKSVRFRPACHVWPHFSTAQHLRAFGKYTKETDLSKESSLCSGFVLHAAAPYIMHDFCSRQIHNNSTQHYFWHNRLQGKRPDLDSCLIQFNVKNSHRKFICASTTWCRLKFSVQNMRHLYKNTHFLNIYFSSLTVSLCWYIRK